MPFISRPLYLGSWSAQTRARSCIDVRNEVDFTVEIRTGSGFQLSDCKNHHQADTVQSPLGRARPYHAWLLFPCCCHILAITVVTCRTHVFAFISKDSLMWTHQRTRPHYSFREGSPNPYKTPRLKMNIPKTHSEAFSSTEVNENRRFHVMRTARKRLTWQTLAIPVRQNIADLSILRKHTKPNIS